MANKVTFPDGGSGQDCLKGGLIVGTTPIVSPPLSMDDVDGLSLQLVVDYQVDAVAHDVADNVVASTKVFTFANYTFTGLTGAKIQITGAANAGNNGTFVISSVSGHTATSSTATGLVDETFGPNVVVNVIRSETASKPAGSWSIAASNDYVAPGTSKFGVPPNPGHFATVTTMFYFPAPTPVAIAAVTDAGSQYVQAGPHFDGGTIQITFTPTGGLGTPKVYPLGKSWSR